MALIESLLATAAAMVSAFAFYARARRRESPGTTRRLGNAGVGLVAIAVSLVLWIDRLGAGAGTCAALGGWMAAAIAWPYLAWLADASKAARR